MRKLNYKKIKKWWDYNYKVFKPNRNLMIANLEGSSNSIAAENYYIIVIQMRKLMKKLKLH